MFIKAAYKFLSYLKIVNNASEHTIRNYSIDLNALKDFLEPPISKEAYHEPAPKIYYNRTYDKDHSEKQDTLNLGSIDRRTIRKFLANQTENKISKRSLVRRISSLRSFFKYLFSKKIIQANPFEDIDSPRLDKFLPNSLNYEQIQNLLDQPDIETYLGFRDRCIMELLYSSGLRVSELTALNRNDLDYKQLIIKLSGKGKKKGLFLLRKMPLNGFSLILNTLKEIRTLMVT